MNPHAETAIASKIALLKPNERAAVRLRFQRVLDDPAYAEQVRLARKPIVSMERHLRQARDLIEAIDALA